jgi:hypothetical protein
MYLVVHGYIYPHPARCLRKFDDNFYISLIDQRFSHIGIYPFKREVFSVAVNKGHLISNSHVASPVTSMFLADLRSAYWAIFSDSTHSPTSNTVRNGLITYQPLRSQKLASLNKYQKMNPPELISTSDPPDRPAGKWARQGTRNMKYDRIRIIDRVLNLQRRQTST